MDKEAVSLGLMYKNLIGRLKGLVISPQKEWSLIFSERKTINEVLAQFSFPLLGVYTITIFIGYLLSHQVLDFGTALKQAVFTFSSNFFGLYAGYFILIKLAGLMKSDVEKEKLFHLLAYAAGITYITGSVIALIPETIVIASLVNLYVIYLVWQAVTVMKPETDDSRIGMSIIISLLILVIPALISRLFVFISNLTV
ncbi:YIP1 family protein [Carboxylicivirga taeanensis]|uniref:YIP1 family protein n=1 Tax=Carboxylicivirga taeanensis TaxID=1416875 RepID=UPI003F6DD3ED